MFVVFFVSLVRILPSPLSMARVLKTSTSLETIKQLMVEDPTDIRVCKNLSHTRYFENRKNQNSQKLDFVLFLQDKARVDSVAETYRWPIRALIQDKDVISLLQEILSYDTEENSRAKMEFYFKAIRAAAQFYFSKQVYEDIANRSQHLGVIAKMAALDPNLAKDQEFVSLCQRMENSFKIRQEVDIKEERQVIMKMINERALKPWELDFDSDHFIKLKMALTLNGLEFSLSGKNP